MIDLSTGTVAPVSAPPLAPLDRPIDFEHLSRMTLGDRSLEREVLELFDRQADMLLARMRHGTASVVAAMAHTLKGSARGIGAWHVAKASEAVELAANSLDTDELLLAVDRLSGTVAEARAVIGDLLRSH